MNKVNKVNIGERYKRVTFTAYPHESKELVNVVNIVRKYFGFRALELPIAERSDATRSSKSQQTTWDIPGKFLGYHKKNLGLTLGYPKKCFWDLAQDLGIPSGISQSKTQDVGITLF